MLAQLKHLFTPQKSNNHRSRLLHPAGISLLVALYLFSHAAVKLYSSYNHNSVHGFVLGYASDISIQQVIDATNQERIKQGKQALTYNATLSLAAQAKASDMFAFDYWAHNNPNNGRTPWSFIKSAGYSYRYAGENLARDFGDTPSMMAAWMASPTHRDNIISNHYTEIGVAVVNGTLQGIETTLVVQMFGNPTSSQAVSSATLGQNSQIASSAESHQKQSQEEPSASIPVESTAVFQPVSIAHASGNETNRNIVAPISISKAISLSILILLSLTLIVDYYFTKHRRTIRLSSKNLAHLAFLSIVIIVVIISSQGGVL